MSRFSNLRVLTFGLTGGISNPNGENHVEEIELADVILCEYGSVSRMKKALSKMGVSPFSVVVDLRHFFGLRKALGAGNLSTTMSRDDTDFPSEIKSNSWWGDIVAVVKNRDTRCLLLEYYDSDPLSLSNCGLAQKEHISILAKRAACIIGPQVFDSKSHSVQREVITWARKKGKKDITDKSLRVRKVLSDAIDPMCFRVAKPIVPSADFKWELRPCEMATVQREEYEKCCFEVRGALTSTLYEEPNSDAYNYSTHVVSSALFRLRQQCCYSQKLAIPPHSALHDKSHRIPLKYSSGLSSAANIRSSNVLVNASQPDANNAYYILNSSSKLKELVSILVTEGGYNLNFEESTKQMLGIFAGARKGKEVKRSAKKIVIFATLPDIQHIVSALLDSLGIQNELLSRLGTCAKNGDHDETKSSSPDHYMKQHSAITWTKSQSILSAFYGQNHCRKTDIIIAAPAAFSGRNDGIGVEGADIIITLDSDWSRRDGFIVNTLVQRWCARNKFSGKENKLIRLVCADSVEEKVFCDSDDENEALVWPLDSDGFFTLPNSREEAIRLYKGIIKGNSSSFPAVGILQNRGDSLENVLVSPGRLPSFFGSGEAPKFLPRLHHTNNDKALTQQEAIAELHFLRYFLWNEKNGSVFTSELTRLAKLPMTMDAIPAGLASRQDISVIESRLLLEKFINSNSPRSEIEDNSSMHVLQPQVSLLDGGQATEESSVPKIDENPSSLLFYEPILMDGVDSDRLLSKNSESRSINAISQRRHNAYAKLFSKSWNGVSVKDGNQGCEPLVFFPPLFPLLEESSKRARIEYLSSAKVTGDCHGTTVLVGNQHKNLALKRKNRDFATTQNDAKSDRKRPKMQSATVLDMNAHPGGVSSCGTGVQESSAQALATSKDQSENGNGNTISANSKSESKTNEDKSPGFIMLEEDFGLLGTGAFPGPIDAVSFSSREPKPNCSSLSSSNRFDSVSYKIPYDAEETSASAIKAIDEGMDSVLLFVKKRPRSSQTAYKHGQGSPSIAPLPISSRIVGDESGKKVRKKGSQGNVLVTPTAFTRLPISTGNVQSQMLPRVPLTNSKQVKGDYRHRLLASLKATGLTLFDSVPYRKAVLRIEEKVTKRLENLMWKSTLTLDSGPGLPIELAEKSYSIEKGLNDHRKGWASIIQQPKDGSMPGDFAKTQSSMQKLELKRSLVSPRCVDFGAFEVGYLSSPSGMTAISTPHFRLGVSLPMGVKVMQPTNDQTKCSTWKMRDDKILQEAAKKFGMNWLLVASAMSGFEHVVINTNPSGVDQIVPSIPKSARQCRDRWQILVQSQPSLANEVRHLKGFFHEPALSRYRTIEKTDASNKEGRTQVLSTEGLNVFFKSTDFLNSNKTIESTMNTEMPDVDQRDDRAKRTSNSNAKSNLIDSPRSTVDKKDDGITSKDRSSHDVRKNPNNAVEITEDVGMTDTFRAKKDKPKRRSYSAISMARSRRQVFPITIPGIDMGGTQAGHPVPSHPSHMQSVQRSVAAHSSGRTEMWPLQILDLADRQRSNAARVSSMQRGEIIPTAHNNPPRHHPSGSSSYQNRPQHPSKSAAVRAPVGYSPGLPNTGQPVALRPLNASVAPRHRHRSPPVAGVIPQAYIPPQANSTAKPKKNDHQKPTNKASPKKGDTGV